MGRRYTKQTRKDWATQRLFSGIKGAATRTSQASPLTLRLDEKTRKRIARIASRKQVSTSEVVRRAIEAWADLQEPVTSPYEAIKDLIGVVHGGNPKGSVRTGRRFAKLLKRRRSGR